MLLVEVARDGAASQQLTVSGQRQLQQLTDDDVETAIVGGTVLSPSHLHQPCYQSPTNCPAHYDDSPRCRTSPPVVGSGRLTRIVIDALPTSFDDAQRCPRRLPTSQITCRIIQRSPVVHCSPHEPTTGCQKLVMPACDGRHWRSAVGTRTGLTNGDRHPHRLLTTQCHLRQQPTHMPT